MIAEAELDTNSPFGTYKANRFERLTWTVTDWAALPRRWRQKLRKRFARPVKGPFDITCEEMRFRLYPAENYCDRVLFARNTLPERAEHEALSDLIAPGLVFVDIGANIGSYSIYVGRKAANDATLLALEPHPRTCEKLRYNLEANDLPTDNVVNCAIGPKRTEMKLWSDGGSNIGHTSLLKKGTANAKIGLAVQVVPLRDVLHERNIDRIDILKIDVEGFEDRALAPFLDGSDETLLPRHILIETAHRHLWERDLTGLLTQRGYQPRFSTAENQLLSRV